MPVFLGIMAVFFMGYLLWYPIGRLTGLEQPVTDDGEWVIYMMAGLAWGTVGYWLSKWIGPE